MNKKGDVPTQYMQAPELPHIFPPKGHVGEYTVQSGERWIDIAERHGVGGWELIEFNFGSRDEKVYNWCMKYDLGCTHTTEDGLRYNFHQCTKGKIYIPPVGWTPPGHDSGMSERMEALRKGVYKVLGSTDLHSVRFYNPYGTRTRPDMFIRVASLLARDLIHLELRELAVANEYDPDDNIIILTDADTSDDMTRSAIVHEAVHAAQDAEGGVMLAHHAECDGYIAQMIYLANQQWGSPPSPPAPPMPVEQMGDPQVMKDWRVKKSIAAAERGIYKLAWDIGQKVILTDLGREKGFIGPYMRTMDRDGMPMIPKDEYDNLAVKILTHPLYHHAGTEWANNNGV